MNPLAWAGATKALVLLSVALAASLAMNGLLLKDRWVTYGEQKTEKKYAPVVAENAGLKQAEAINKGIASVRREEHAQLLDRLGAIAERGGRFEVRYVKAAAAKPLPANCAPGAERQAAVNEFLGPQPAASEKPR